MECPVCFSETKLPIVCSKCKLGACRPCTKRYLCSTNLTIPNCMHCKINWSFDFVANNTEDSFHNQEYRNYRAKLLFEREKSLFQETQEIVKKERDSKKLEDKKTKNRKRIEEIEKKYEKELGEYKNVLRERRKARKNSKKEGEIKLKVKKLRKETLPIREKISKLKKENKELTLKIREVKMAIVPQEKKEKQTFTVRCSEESCKGFLVQDPENKKLAYCGLCDKKVCGKCFEKVHEEKCKSDILSSIKMLKSDTKNCPSCKALIYKIDGCDQMYCMECHTAFSWKTLQVETGRIHNPHYYEYQRKTRGFVPREQNDIVNQCHALTFEEFFYGVMNKGFGAYLVFFEELFRFNGHILGVIVPRYNLLGNYTNNIDLRIAFLKNEISQEKFIDMIKRREKRREKLLAVNLILTMFVRVSDSLLTNLLETNTEEEVENIISEIENFRVYTNEELKKISQRFKNKVKSIDKNYLVKHWY